jgi:hypothetical protein
MQKGTLQPGLPIPDEASSRQHCLYTGVDAPDLATVKDFLRFYIATSRGKIDENERPTVDSLKTFAEWFFADFTRITGIPTDEADRSEGYNVGALPQGRGGSKLIVC